MSAINWIINFCLRADICFKLAEPYIDTTDNFAQQFTDLFLIFFLQFLPPQTLSVNTTSTNLSGIQNVINLGEKNKTLM